MSVSNPHICAECGCTDMIMYRHIGTSITCSRCRYVLVEEHSPFGKRIDDKINDLSDLLKGNE